MSISRVSPVLLAGMVTVVGLCAYVAFYGYGIQRASSGPLGRDLDQKLGYAIRVGVFLSPFMLVVATPVWALQHYRRVARPQARLKAGLCPACAYPIASHVCPECGAEPVEPADSAAKLAGRYAFALVLLLVIGVAAGSFAAEAMIAPDEHAFMAEVQQLGPTHARLRRGPFYGELSHDPAHGYWVVDD